VRPDVGRQARPIELAPDAALLDPAERCAQVDHVVQPARVVEVGGGRLPVDQVTRERDAGLDHQRSVLSRRGAAPDG
jgi:hypothetical protein